jgi:hypothetical protein
MSYQRDEVEACRCLSDYRPQKRAFLLNNALFTHDGEKMRGCYFNSRAGPPLGRLYADPRLIASRVGPRRLRAVLAAPLEAQVVEQLASMIRSYAARAQSTSHIAVLFETDVVGLTDLLSPLDGSVLLRKIALPVLQRVFQAFVVRVIVIPGTRDAQIVLRLPD